MEHKVGNFWIDHSEANRPNKIETIRKTLSEIFNISIDRVIEKETDKDFQKSGKGDYILINNRKQGVYLEWKSNRFYNWGVYKDKRRVLFETHGNTKKKERGENIFTTKAVLWAHSFWNKDDTEIMEVLLYDVKLLRNYLISRQYLYKNKYYTHNKGKNGEMLYDTEWILVPSIRIKKFLYKHYIKVPSIGK